MRNPLLLLATLLATSQAYQPVVVVRMFASEVPPPAQRVQFESFATALQNLDFRALARDDLPPEPRALGAALRDLTEGKRDAARQGFSSLAGSSNAGIARLASQLEGQLLFNAGEYAGLRDRMAEAGEVDAGVRVLAGLSPERFSSLDTAVADRLWLAPSSVPLIQVEANGVEQGFAFDTGASFSVVRSGLAGTLGVRLVSADVGVGTSTDIEIRARYGILPELRVGRVLIRDHIVLVLDDDDLDFLLPNGTRFQLDGIVGWNAIRRMRVELDYPAGVYAAEISMPRADAHRNFFWLGYPLVRVTARDGQMLLFGLDTGSRNTSITGNIFSKVQFERVQQRRETIGGAGGSRQVVTDVVDLLELVITGHRFEVSLARREDDTDAAFVAIDGTLGSDISPRCLVVIDFANAHFAISLAD